MTAFAFDLGEWFTANRRQVRRDLDRYFSGNLGDMFSGRWFDKFAAMGDVDVFGPSDVLSVEALSVRVRPESAAKLIIADADRFNSLLQQIPKGVDLWDVDPSLIDVGSPAAELHGALDGLPRVGWVTAGKLMAAKRPRLIPILDKEVKGLLNPPRGRFWASMYEQLSVDARRRAIAEVCEVAPDGVTLLRRIDVALWMHATQRQPSSTSRSVPDLDDPSD